MILRIVEGGAEKVFLIIIIRPYLIDHFIILWIQLPRYISLLIVYVFYSCWLNIN